MRDKGKIKGLPRPGFGAFAGLGFRFSCLDSRFGGSGVFHSGLRGLGFRRCACKVGGLHYEIRNLVVSQNKGTPI